MLLPMGVWSWTISTLLLSAQLLYSGSMNPATSAINPSMQQNRRNQHCNILVWNVQGACSREVVHVLREHIHIHRPNIVALVETRISGTQAQAVCDKIGFRNNYRAEARGFQGGIWVL